MPERNDRQQRDYENRDRNDRQRDSRSSGYSRSSARSGDAGYSEARRSSYARDYSRQAGAGQSRGYRREGRQTQYSDYRQGSGTSHYSEGRRDYQQPRDYRAADGRRATGDRYGQRPASDRYRSGGQSPTSDRYRSGGQRPVSERYRSDGYRQGVSSRNDQRRAYGERGASRTSRDYAQRSGRGGQASGYGRSTRPRDTYQANPPAERQPQRESEGYARDAFDPRKNLQGGRNALQGARGFRASGGGRASHSFDIADVFQMGKFVLVGIVALIVIILIARGIYFASPSTYQVDGQEVSLARGTTYQGLVDSGALEVSPGNLVAVDGEVLQERGGNAPKVYLDGEPV
jgi:sulfur carrier protein ThiS